MSNDKLERPASLKRAPKPAADDNLDPVDVAPATTPAKPAADAAPPAAPPQQATTPAPATPAPAGRRREVTIQLSSRVAVDVIEILDQVVAEHGLSQRAAIETAIREHWGKK